MSKAKISAFTVLLVVGLAISILPAPGVSAWWTEDKLMAGAYSLTITPTYTTPLGTPAYDEYGSPVFLAGFGSFGSRPCERIHDDIYARSLALSDGETTIVFVALDLIGYFIDQVDLIRQVDFGIEVDHIIIASTHTHSGPDTLGLWNYPPGVNGPYMDYVRERIIESIDNALQNMQKAKIRFASTTAPGLMKNSRDQLPKYAVTYPDLEVMKVENTAGGTIATMINFAGHPEVLWSNNLNMSSDYVGYLRGYVEEEFGGVAVFFNGALGGMVTPDTDEHTFDEADRIGETLADATLEALEDAKVSRKMKINVEKEIIEVPLENPAFFYGMLGGVLARSYPWFEYPGGVEFGIIRTEVDVVQIGKAQMITMPGEVLPSIGHRLKNSMTGKYNFEIGLGNDELGYIISEEEWDWTGNWTLPLPPEFPEFDGKYEESMAVGPAIAIEMESTLTKMLSRVVAEGEGSVVVEDPEYSGPATLYIAGVISLKVVGWEPLFPWWMIPPPRPEEWKAPWVQWDIIFHAIVIVSGQRREYYLGYNDELGYILVRIYEGQVTACGPAVSFSGVV